MDCQIEKTKCSFFLSTTKTRTLESQPSDTSKLVTQKNDLKAVVTSAQKTSPVIPTLKYNFYFPSHILNQFLLSQSPSESFGLEWVG